MKKGVNIFEHTDCISEDMLAKYLSDKLSPAEKHEVEKHLVDCEMCSDAVEGLSMVSGKKIFSITAELKQKIQNRVEKKEVKIIFLRQYRTQLAVAASIILVVGLVWFFKANMSMKEMDSDSADKMFAEKFVPPPADLNKEQTAKQQAEPNTKNPVTTVQEPTPRNNVSLDEAKKKVVAEETPSYSSAGEAKAGKDIPEEKHLGWAEKSESRKLEEAPVRKIEQSQENITVQNADQLRKGVVSKKSEEKEDKNYYWRDKAAETPKGNVTAKSEVTTRDEDASGVKDEKDELAKVTVVTKEVSKNQNELEALKEKDKKDESKKAQPTATTSNAEVATATGASSVSANQPVTDKVSGLTKQDSKKTIDDRERPDANNVNRAQNGEGDVLAYESGKKSKETKSGGKGKEESAKFKKAKAPQKVSSGYADMQTTTTSAPMPETQSQTKTAQTQSMAGENINGKQADSTVVLGGSFGTTLALDAIAVDSSMIKYNKQDYTGALRGFEQTLKQNPNDEKALFYSAISYLSLGQTEKALMNFNKILANKNSKYYDDAQWYSSLAYIKNNDTKNARMNLQQLQNNEKSKYKKQADETLREMKK